MRRLFTLLFLLPVAVSCLEQPDCINKKNDLIGISFKSMKTRADTTYIIDSVAAERIAVTFVPSEAAVGKIVLPLDYFNDTTFYILQINDTIHQLTLTYRAQPQFVSEECGERFILDNLQVAKHSFDSVSIIRAQPGVDGNANNVEVFR